MGSVAKRKTEAIKGPRTVKQRGSSLLDAFNSLSITGMMYNIETDVFVF